VAKTKRYLVATEETQGERKNDFNWCGVEEPVYFGFECDGGSVDDRCGCKRAMSGVDTAKATTTMRVHEVDKEELTSILQRLTTHFEDGWKMTREEALNEAEEQVKEVLRIAEVFPPGTIIEKRGRNLQARRAANG